MPPPLFAVCSPEEKKRFEDFFSFLVSYFAGERGGGRKLAASSAMLCQSLRFSFTRVSPCCMCALRYLLFRSPSSSSSSVLDFARGSIPPPARAFPNAHRKEIIRVQFSIFSTHQMCEFALPPSTISHFVTVASARGVVKRETFAKFPTFTPLSLFRSALKNSGCRRRGNIPKQARGRGRRGV